MLIALLINCIHIYFINQTTSNYIIQWFFFSKKKYQLLDSCLLTYLEIWLKILSYEFLNNQSLLVFEYPERSVNIRTQSTRWNSRIAERIHGGDWASRIVNCCSVWARNFDSLSSSPHIWSGLRKMQLQERVTNHLKKGNYFW